MFEKKALLVNILMAIATMSMSVGAIAQGAEPTKLSGVGDTPIEGAGNYILTGDYTLIGERGSAPAMIAGKWVSNQVGWGTPEIDLNGHTLKVSSLTAEGYPYGAITEAKITGTGNVVIEQLKSGQMGLGYSAKGTTIQADNITITANRYAIQGEEQSHTDLSTNNGTGVITLISKEDEGVYAYGGDRSTVNIHDFAELNITAKQQGVDNQGGNITINGGKVSITSLTRSAFVNHFDGNEYDQNRVANTIFEVDELTLDATIDGQTEAYKIAAFGVGSGTVTVNAKKFTVEVKKGKDQKEPVYAIYLFQGKHTQADGTQEFTINTDLAKITGDVTAILGTGNLNAKTLQVDGNVDIREDATLPLTFDGAQSTLTGSAKVEGQNNAVSFTNGANWNVTGASNVTALTFDNATIDTSKTDGDLVVSKLSGAGGTVVMDAAKTNKVDIADVDAQTKITVKASENADKVNVGQAVSMVDRLEGVTNKTGRVDEGMYQGAITVDRTGHATQAKNDLMADTLELASASTLSLNRILMNDVRKRLGDIRSAEEVNGVWARYDGGRLSGEGTKNKFNTIHVGGDTMPFADTPVRVGVAASYTNGDVDYTRGDADLDAYSLAAYGTWMNDNGMFADVIARVAKAESDMTVDSVYKGKLKNMAYSLSGEFGWRFDLNNMFYAEPQVEATYTYIDSDKLTLAGKNETYNYGVESFDSFIGRMGVLAGMKCPNQKGDVYVRASVVHEFLGDATINGGNVATLERDGKDTWFEYGIGANVNVGKNTYLWADLERTAGALVDEDIRGTLGVRFGF